MGIYLWGTGCGAAELVDKVLPESRIDGFVETVPRSAAFMGKPVYRPRELDIGRCSLMIVTTRHAQAVARTCREIGLPENRILYVKDSWVLEDRNRNCTVAESILGKEVLDQLLSQYRVIPVPGKLRKSQLPPEALAGDYVRLSTLELLCGQVSQVPGAAAELGVYRGFFAGCINRLLPERAFYLFDSFQGFDEFAGAGPAFQQAHGNTDPETVLKALPYREQARVYPGFFPGSLRGLEERFCLVSLDGDFYQVTLDGLRYFWPRLNPGGFLLLHDWGNPNLPGVRQALEDYEEELGHPLTGVPLCDSCVSLVLPKPRDEESYAL